MVAQLAVAVWGIAPGLAEELGPAPPTDLLERIPEVLEVHDAAGPLAATGLPAVALVVVLAAALVVLARPTLRPLVLLGLLTLAVTVAVLAAGRCADGRATATGLRWSLAICFVVCSLPVWLRDRLGPWAAPWGVAAPEDTDLASWARQALVLSTVVPVLALTVGAALAGVFGSPVLGPAPDSAFARMGRLWAGAWPLGLVCLGLVVHALRERLPAYAFVVGLGGNVLASLLLRSTFRKTPLADWWLPLLQANALAFGAAALLWLSARRRLYAERGTGALLVAQVALGAVANAVLLAAVLGFLVLTPGSPPLPVSQAGSVLGWLALGLTAAAVAWNARANGSREHLTPAVLLALAVGVLLAASSVRLGAAPPWLAYHVLTASWAVVAAGLLVVGWRRPAGAGMFPAWVQDVALLVLGLALVGVAGDPWRGWSPGVVLFVSALCAALAIWQRRESRALFAGLGLNLAATLALPCFLAEGTPLLEQVPLLVRVNLLVAAGAALLWLAGGRWLYGLARPDGRTAPLLHVQVFGLLALGAVLLLLPLAGIVFTPGELPEALTGATVWDGLVALTLALATLVFARRTGSVSLLQLAGGWCLALGVLLAWAAVGRTPDAWAPYRVLEVSWAAAGVLMLAVVVVADRRRPEGLEEPGFVEWVLTFGVLVLWLAWRAGLRDPAGPWWSAALAAVLALELTVLAWWRRGGKWLFLAGLCAQFAVGLVRHRIFPAEAGSGVLEAHVQAAAVVAGLTALAWLAAAPRLYGQRRPSLFDAPLLVVQLILAVGLVVVLLLGPVVQLVEQPGGTAPLAAPAGGLGGWLALLASAVPVGWYAGAGLRRRLVPLLTGFGLLLGVLLACSVARTAPGWPAFHTLAGAWTGVGVLLLLLAFPHGARWRSALAAACVAGLGGLVLWLAVRVAEAEAFGRAATVAGPVAVLAVGLAVRRRREVWAFVAALVLQLTATFLVLHGQQVDLVPSGSVFLLQTATAVAALFALVWLALCRPLYGVRLPGAWVAPLLALQIVLPAVANVALLAEPLTALVLEPGRPGEGVVQAGHAAGWAALALTLVAVAVYAGRTLARGATHGLCGLGLAVGVLAACTAARWDGAGQWLAYHTLTVGWAALGAVVVAGGWWRAQGRLVAAWAVLAAALVLALGLRGLAGGDPSAPWGPAATVLAAGALAGGLALWRRREAWALAATACGNLAVCLVLTNLHRADLADWWPTLVRVNVFALTAAASLWLLAARRLYGVARPTRAAAPLLTAIVAVVAVGAVCLTVDPAVRLVLRPQPVSTEVLDAGRPLSWLAVLAAGVLAIRHLRLRLSRSGPGGFAAFGLAVAALAANAASWLDRDNWLAFHVLAVGVVGAGGLVLLRGRALAQSPRLLDVPPGITPSVLGWRLDLALAVVLALGFGLALRETVGVATGVGFPAVLLVLLAGQAGVRALWRCSETWAAVATLGSAFAVSLVVWDLHGRGLGRDEWTPLLQVNSVMLSLGALLWLAAEGRKTGRAGLPLVGVEVLLALVGNAWLLLDPPLLALIRSPQALPASVRAAGAWDFWLTFGVTALAACVTLHVRRPRFGVHVLGGLGVAFGVLLACTAAWADHGDFLAYHVLLVAWTLQAALLVGAAWWEDQRTSAHAGGQPRLSAAAAQGWLILLGVPLLGLAVRGVLADPSGAWWSAAPVLVVAALAALLAAWLRHPAWALAAGLGIDLALSLVVWREHAGQPLNDWLLPLGQVVVVAVSLAALLWLVLGRRSVGVPRGGMMTNAPPLADSFLLVVQVLVALAGNLALLVVPVFDLVVDPESPSPLASRVGGLFGWLALLPALTAALWLAGRRFGAAAVARLAPGTLALAALAACSVARADGDNWLAYRVLLTGLALAGPAVLAAVGLARRDGTLVSPGEATAWAMSVGGLLVVLASRAFLADPSGPWWAAAAAGSAGVLAAGLAAWRRSALAAFMSCLCVNLAVTMPWWRAASRR